MEISGLEVGINLSLDSQADELRQWFQNRLQMGREPVVRAATAQEDLSELLFGLQLDPRELHEYKILLLRSLELIERLEYQEDLPDPRRRRRARKRRSQDSAATGGFRVGGVFWQVPPWQLPPPDAALPPGQAAHLGQILEMSQLCRNCGLALDPGQDCGVCGLGLRELVSRTVVSVLNRGQMREVGEDQVEMTRESLADLVEPRDREGVLISRMPPAFPRYRDILERRRSRGA